MKKNGGFKRNIESPFAELLIYLSVHEKKRNRVNKTMFPFSIRRLDVCQTSFFYYSILFIYCYKHKFVVIHSTTKDLNKISKT